MAEGPGAARRDPPSHDGVVGDERVEGAGSQRRRPDDRRLKEIFGDDAGSPQRDVDADERAREDWYRENRPPHHDGP